MKSICPSFLLFSVLCLLASPEAVRGITLNLSLDGGGGYETGVYDPMDSSINGAWFLSSSVEPSYAFPTNSDWRTTLSLPFSGTFRESAGNDLCLEPGVLFSRDRNNRSLNLRAVAAYSKQPGNLDPDQPLEDMLYKLSAEYGTKSKMSLKFSYVLSLLDEFHSRRADVKNKARLKVGFKPGKLGTTGVGIGAGANVSTTEGYTYSEFDLSFNTTLFIAEKDMLMGMVYWAQRNYPQDQFGSGGGLLGDKSKRKDGAGFGKDADLVVYHSSVGLTYIHPLTDEWDFEASYDYISYLSGFDGSNSGSHRLYAGFSLQWN
jgi:hypothetical protein